MNYPAPANCLIISNDGNFTYLLGLRGYNILLAQSQKVPSAMEGAANTLWRWSSLGLIFLLSHYGLIQVFPSALRFKLLCVLSNMNWILKKGSWGFCIIQKNESLLSCKIFSLSQWRPPLYLLRKSRGAQRASLSSPKSLRLSTGLFIVICGGCQRLQDPFSITARQHGRPSC